MTTFQLPKTHRKFAFRSAGWTYISTLLAMLLIALPMFADKTMSAAIRNDTVASVALALLIALLSAIIRYVIKLAQLRALEDKLRTLSRIAKQKKRADESGATIKD